MKILETEFVSNADKRGDQKFVQVKRNEHAAIYQRFTMDGKPLEFEVFQIKVAGGNEIFGRFYEEYEQYPGAAAFGRSAWSVITLERAEQIFEEITKGEGKRNKGQEAVEAPVRTSVKGGRKGRPRVVRPEIVLPKKKFCMKDLVIVNKVGWSQPTLYIELTKLVKQDKVVEAERVQKGRGRATVFYKVKA
jgi:hypothetical protein